MNKKITIAGLGWLGLPFAAQLKTLGYQVKGSVTDTAKAKRLTQNGIPAYPLVIAEDGVAGFPDTLLADTDVLGIMIPPGLRKNTGANYALRMAHFLHCIEATEIDKVILISSTSVYDDSQGKVTEKDIPQPQTNAGKQLHEVEQIFFNSSRFTCAVVRFGGLYGDTRNPVKFLAGRKNLSNGEAPVNLIHRKDCIGILLKIIKKDAFGHIFNAVAPEHPTKASYYTEQAKLLGVEPPSYTTANMTNEIFKQVDSIHLSSILGYTFRETLQ